MGSYCAYNSCCKFIKLVAKLGSYWWRLCWTLLLLARWSGDRCVVTMAMSLFKFDDFRRSPDEGSTAMTFFFRLSFLEGAPSLRFRFFVALLGSLCLGFAAATCLSSWIVDVATEFVKVTRPFLYWFNGDWLSLFRDGNTLSFCLY